MSYVFLTSEAGSVRVPLEMLALWHLRGLDREIDQEAIEWAKSDLLDLKCEPCEKCDFSGQLNCKFLGELEITLKKGAMSIGGSKIQKLDRDKTLPPSQYFLQLPRRQFRQRAIA